MGQHQEAISEGASILELDLPQGLVGADRKEDQHACRNPITETMRRVQFQGRGTSRDRFLVLPNVA